MSRCTFPHCGCPERARCFAIGDALRTIEDYRRWLGSHEFPEIARVLDNLYAELIGEPLNAGTPGESDNCVISSLREQLRRRVAKAPAQPVDPDTPLETGEADAL